MRSPIRSPARRRPGSIHPTTGLFTWTPSNNQGPNTYTITVVATDNGSPTLSSSTTFNVTVNDSQSPFTVTNTNDSGTGSLRQAMLTANATPGADAIQFAIGSGVQTIAPLSPLPTITDAVTIDGTTQPGYAGTPIIEIRGDSGGAGIEGLTIRGENSTVRGLVINRFGSTQIWINGSGASGNVIAGNFLGLDQTGTIDVTTGSAGVIINGGATINIIGGSDPASRNIISGNDHGIIIENPTTSGNRVEGNYIGLDVTGTVAIGNALHNVRINDSPNNTVGGPAASAANVIAGSGREAIWIEGAGATGNVIQGNFIGTDVSGTLALPNQQGIGFYPTTSNNSILGNVIAASREEGIVVDGAGQIVQGNYIGTNAAGSTSLGNAFEGVVLVNSSALIGGTLPGAGNMIAYNGRAGVAVVGTGGTGNAIRGNSIHDNGGIGIDLNADGPTPNDAGDADIGVNQLQNSPVILNVHIDAAGNLVASYKVDSATANASYPLSVDFYQADSADSGEGAVYLATSTYSTADLTAGIKTINLGSAASLGVSRGDPIVATATDANGNTSEFSAVASNYTTFLVTSTADSGLGSLRQAMTDANAQTGADTIQFAIGSGTKSITPLSALPTITDAVTIDGTTQPGFAGTPIIELSGASAGAGVVGLTITGGGSLIRGLVMNRFSGDAIDVQSSNNQIAGNYLGTDVAGVVARPNRLGVAVSGIAHGNIIGGLSAADRNLLSGNTSVAVFISGPDASGNSILGNYIGTNAAGTAALANSTYGIIVHRGSGNIIGAPGAGNIISGNVQGGIAVHSTGPAATSFKPTRSAPTSPARSTWETRSTAYISAQARASTRATLGLPPTRLSAAAAPAKAT